MGGLDELEVVDPGGRCGWRLVGAGVRVHVPADAVRHAGSHGPALIADVDPGQVERVEDDLDAAADQGGVDGVDVAVQADRGGLGDRAGL